MITARCLQKLGEIIKPTQTCRLPYGGVPNEPGD
jgi:hypothetical protein